MFSKLWQFIREVLSKMFPTQNIKQAMGVNTVVSPQMNSALQLWSLMYANQAPWLNEGVTSLGLPVSISSEIARMATIEMKVEISGSPRAEFLCEQLEKLLPKIRQYIEYGNAKGGLIFKPYVINGEIAFDCVQADMFLPVSFDTNGNISHVVFADSRRVGQYWYTRYESHSLVGNVITIRNVAYKSSTQYSLGSQCALSEIADWEGLREESGVKDVIAPLYGYYRYPSANNVDTTSPLGVSCYSRAQDANGGVQLIQQADGIYSSLVWEFESGKRALYVDEMAFGKGEDGKPRLPDRRLYRTLQTSANIGTGKEFFEVWSPEFRDASIKSGLNAVLRQIEFACGLQYGVLSDPQAVALTATEIKASQQRTYSTITDTQKAVETALEQLIYAMDVYADLYNLAPRGTYEVTYDFDDSIVSDHDAQFTQDGIMVDKGAMSLAEYRMRTYGEDEKTAKEKILMAQTEKQARVVNRVNTVRVPNQNMPMDGEMNNAEQNPAGQAVAANQ